MSEENLNQDLVIRETSELDSIIESLSASDALDDVSITVKPGEEDTERDYEYLGELEDIYRIPNRDWEFLINFFNKLNPKKKFPFTSLQCKSIIYNIAKGQFVGTVFKAFGISSQKYNVYKSQAEQIETQLAQFEEKDSFTEEDKKQYSILKFNALRVLFSDIEKAEAIAQMIDMDALNEWGRKDSNVFIQKVRAKYKELNGNDSDKGQSMNVQIIRLGGDFINDLLQ